MIMHYIVLIVMTMLGSVASLYLKKASEAKGIFEMIKNKYLYIGGFLYFGSAVLNIWILRYLDYSVVLPLTSFTYIWTIGLSHVLLNEEVTKKKIIGVGMVFMGAICVSV